MITNSPIYHQFTPHVNLPVLINYFLILIYFQSAVYHFLHGDIIFACCAFQFLSMFIFQHMIIIDAVYNTSMSRIQWPLAALDMVMLYKGSF